MKKKKIDKNIKAFNKKIIKNIKSLFYTTQVYLMKEFKKLNKNNYSYLIYDNEDKQSYVCYLFLSKRLFSLILLCFPINDNNTLIHLNNLFYKVDNYNYNDLFSDSLKNKFNIKITKIVKGQLATKCLNKVCNNISLYIPKDINLIKADNSWFLYSYNFPNLIVSIIKEKEELFNKAENKYGKIISSLNPWIYIVHKENNNISFLYSCNAAGVVIEDMKLLKLSGINFKQFKLYTENYEQKRKCNYTYANMNIFKQDIEKYFRGIIIKHNKLKILFKLYDEDNIILKIDCEKNNSVNNLYQDIVDALFEKQLISLNKYLKYLRKGSLFYVKNN